jgi:hypothetical protein
MNTPDDYHLMYEACFKCVDEFAGLPVYTNRRGTCVTDVRTDCAEVDTKHCKVCYTDNSMIGMHDARKF